MIPAADHKVGRSYGFRVRLAYKPFVSDDDVIEEYEKAARDLGFERA